MADADDDFGGAEEEEETGGFGGGEEEEEEGGFGDDFGEEDEEEGGGFGDAEPEEDFDEEGAGWGNAEDEDDMPPQKMAPAPAPSKHGWVEQFEEFSQLHFQKSPGTNAKYTIEPITTPLLKLKGPEKEKRACNMFRLVCQFMGITAKVGKGTMRAIETAQAITRFGIEEEHLREELYCQLLKQMNGNPAAASRARGTILFTLVIGTFPCSSKLLPMVDSFIREGPKGYQAYCNLILRRCIHNGARMQPPCSLELEAAKRKQIMRVRVMTDMVTKEAVTARLDAASVMSEWVEEIAAKIGIKNTYGWSIFVDRYGKLESLRGAGTKGLHVMDVISKIDQQAIAAGQQESLDIAGQLSFRKELFATDQDPESDPVATHLSFNQIRQGMKEGWYVCGADEYDEVAAIVYYADFGDDVDSTKVVQFLDFWLPEDAKKKASPEKRGPKVERIHAKSEYSKKKFSRTKTQGLLIKFAIEKWGRVSSFSADGSVMLYPNGNPGGKGPKRASVKKGK